MSLRYCPECKTDSSEIVKAGEKLKESKKKAKMASQQGSSSRDWGRVGNCVHSKQFSHVVPEVRLGPLQSLFAMPVSAVGRTKTTSACYKMATRREQQVTLI